MPFQPSFPYQGSPASVAFGLVEAGIPRACRG